MVRIRQETKDWTKTVKRDNHTSFGLTWLIIPSSLLVQSRLWIFSVCPDLAHWLLALCWPETSSCQAERKSEKEKIQIIYWSRDFIVNLLGILYFYTLTMHTTGSHSFSPGTSIQVISIALGSPGEHGVKRSSTITLLSALDGPRTWFKTKHNKGNKSDNDL